MISILKKLVYSKALHLPRLLIGKAVQYLVTQSGGTIVSSSRKVIVSYEDEERGKVLDLINSIKSETDLQMPNNEAYQLYAAVKSTAKVEGDIAEVGVYKGGSARLILEARGEKSLHLFDTFAGLPCVEEIDYSLLAKGQYASVLKEVKSYLKGFKGVYFYKGLFPKTSKPVENKTFSFVHLDVDTHKSTKACLEFFYPRMNVGGVILSHDYFHFLGVRKAFDDFFEDKPEPIIEMSGSQGLVVKAVK